MNLQLNKNSRIEHIDVNSIYDDAQFLYLYCGKSLSSSKDPLFEIKIGSHKIFGLLKGEIEIVNYKGETIDTPKDYENYLKRGEAGKNELELIKMAYIELVDAKTNKKLNVFFSLADSIKYVEEEFNQNFLD